VNLRIVSITRRSLLLSTLTAQQHSHAATGAPGIEALAAQIIPSDGTPGAKVAGRIHFIDRPLETLDQDERTLYRDGLAAAQKKRGRWGSLIGSTERMVVAGRECGREDGRSSG